MTMFTRGIIVRTANQGFQLKLRRRRADTANEGKIKARRKMAYKVPVGSNTDITPRITPRRINPQYSLRSAVPSNVAYLVIAVNNII